MKFFNEKQLISTVFAISLFNSASAGLFEDALKSINDSINGQQNPNGSNTPNKVFLADAPPDEPINGDDFSALFGKGGLEALGLPQEAIDRAAAAAQNGEGADSNAYSVSTTTTSDPYGPATTTTNPFTSSATTTTSPVAQSSTTVFTSATTAITATTNPFTSSAATTTSSDVQSSTTVFTSATTAVTATTNPFTSSAATTTSSDVQPSTTAATPTSVKPFTSSTTTASSAISTSSTNPSPSTTTSGIYPGPTGNPAPGPNKGIIGVVFDLIKSLVGFLWSFREPLWNFTYNYIIKPIFDWIGKKFSGGGSAYSTQGF